jgi:hypothetical protein
VVDDVLIQKLASIDRCLASVRRYVADDLGRLQNPMVLDAVVRTVVEHRLGDFEALCRELVSAI